MAAIKVLLIGGHGKVALHLTPLLLSKSWDVTSLIRNPDHEAEISKLGEGKPGTLDVLVDSLDDVRSDVDAKRVLDKVNPDIVIWSAGAGGKGGPSRTKAVDEVAAKHYITSSLQRPSVKKFLMVSYIGSRHGRPPWWSDEDYAKSQEVNTKILPAYFKAKVEADEHFAALAHHRNITQKDVTFQGINLRPGTLTDEPGSGKVMLGKTPSRGRVSRASVARVAVELLSRPDTRGWYDLLDGDEDIAGAVSRLAAVGWDGIDGEDLDAIHARS